MSDELNRTDRMAAGGHGHDNRGLEAGAIPGAGYGRYGRMFAFSGHPVSLDALAAIASAMVKPDVSKPITEPEPVDENSTIPAGYTYFGQFVDHDVTFDPSPISVDRMDAAALEDFRTPALDLDCLYGRGPDDQPYMYHDDGLRLREGVPLTAGRGRPTADLFRVPKADDDDKQRAVIGDKRNDENRIVAQLHAVMIRLHNKIVMDPDLVAQFGGDFADPVRRFRAAANCVRWHYQWVVVNDFLANRILAPGTLAKVLDPSNRPTLRFYDKREATYPYVPVEFAGAAYRFGHSMIRPGYSLNADVLTTTQKYRADGTQADGRIPIFSADADPRLNLNGFGVPMPGDWGIDWSFFLPVDRGGNDPAFQLPQPSYRIDALLVAPLANLPEFQGDVDARFRMLAFRNLVRGTNALVLPSGEQIAYAMGETPLTSEELWLSSGTGAALPDPVDPADRDEIVARRSEVWTNWKDELSGNTPLWYYVLREAELRGNQRAPGEPNVGFGGQHLGPVGSLIVAETFVGLLANDPFSYLNRRPMFAPLLGGAKPDFGLADLVTYALS